jgi:rare lipoprotein A
MDSSNVIALSPGAAAQLGASDKAPVRVRRVNPPESERAALRLGGRASDRLETPETLLAVLRRRLPGEGSATLVQAKPAPSELPAAAAPVSKEPAIVAAARPAPATAGASPAPRPLAPLAIASTPVTHQPPRVAATPAPKATPKAKPPAAAQPAVTPNGAYVVQAGAFSTADRAKKVASAIGGSISRSGSLFRVRTGPFGSRKQAEASLAKVKAAGYSDARIFTSG